VAYDPAFAYEIAVIIKEGLRRMFQEGEDVFYYLTLYNENYSMPPMPPQAEEGILRGIYLYRPSSAAHLRHVQLFGGGALMPGVLRAQEMLEENFNISANVWSVTSYQQLRSEALKVERWNSLHPLEKPRRPYIVRILENVQGPVVAVTDFMKAVPDMISHWVPQPWISMGTDGFGRSDTREALRRYFEVDSHSIVIGALRGLAQSGQASPEEVAAAIEELQIDPDKIDPLSI
jgi:pyruvate dehydrogenase E1 component